MAAYLFKETLGLDLEKVVVMLEARCERLDLEIWGVNFDIEDLLMYLALT